MNEVNTLFTLFTNTTNVYANILWHFKVSVNVAIVNLIIGLVKFFSACLTFYGQPWIKRRFTVTGKREISPIFQAKGILDIILEKKKQKHLPYLAC